MAWNNSNNGNWNNNGNRNWNNNGNGGNWNNNNNQQQYKRSGAVYTRIKTGTEKDGHWMVNAWRLTKAGLMTAKCSPLTDYDKNGNKQGVTVHVGSQKGHEFVRYKVEITINGMMQKYYCLMRLDTKTIVINELSLVISPNGRGITRSGKKVEGYFGANFKRK